MRFILLLLSLSLTHQITAQISLDKLKSVANKAQEVISPKSLTVEEITRGLKEALIIGASESSLNASKEGGFNNNLLIRIPFPKDANIMKEMLLKVGMQSQIDEFEYILNLAAEEASNFSKQIFINAIQEMTIEDALSILQGNDDAATNYLKKTTSKKLYITFKPVILRSINKVRLSVSWSSLAERYNAIPLTKDINCDLEDYVTNKVIEGLFILIAQEEKNIRNNPKARVSEILHKVFK